MPNQNQANSTKEEKKRSYQSHQSAHINLKVKGQMDDETKLYICLEAKHNNGGQQQQQHVYLICSLKLNDLTTKLSSDSPALTKQTSFEGYPSMGCGFYKSKIVFAGGQVQETDDELVEQINHNGLITFDMNTKQLSSNSFPSMLRGKVKPLVFQLHDNLYVMDTVSGYRQGSFEYFYPKKQEWNLLRQPTYQYFVHGLSSRRDSNYPCLVLGNACFLSVPTDMDNLLYVHRPNITYKSWLPILTPSDWLPFSGVATFYHQPNFREFFVISFTNRAIRAHFFDIYDLSDQASKEVFRLPSSSESFEDEQMSGYFADFGDGIFSLTASDAVCIHVCTFQIFGLNMPFKFNLLSHYEYKLDALSFGLDIISVVGCFAPDANVQAIKQAEEVFEYRFSNFAKRSDEDPDYFEFRGAKCAVPEGCPGALLTVPFNTPMAPEPVDAFCILAQ